VVLPDGSVDVTRRVLVDAQAAALVALDAWAAVGQSVFDVQAAESPDAALQAALDAQAALAPVVIDVQAVVVSPVPPGVEVQAQAVALQPSRVPV